MYRPDIQEAASFGKRSLNRWDLKLTLGFIQVIDQGSVKVNIPAGQSPVVTLYAPREVHRNADMRNQMQVTAVSALNTAIDSATVSQFALTAELRAL